MADGDIPADLHPPINAAPAAAAAPDDDWAPVPKPATAAPDDDWAPVNPPQRGVVGQASDAVLGYLKTTSTGRTLEAFGQGWSDGWGDQPLGMSKETEKALREAGVFTDVQANHGGIMRAVNEAVMRPAAAGLEAFLRAGSAAAYGVSRAAGENVAAMNEQAGLDHLSAEQHGDELTRDVLALANVLGVIGGGEAGFKGTKPVEAPAAAAEATRFVAKTEREAEPAAAAAAAPVSADAEIAPGAGDRVTASYQPAPPPDQPVAPKPAETMAAPSRPHETYGDAPSDYVDKAGNINLDRINAPDDVKDVIRNVAEANGGFVDARRGTMSYGDIQDLADASGMTAPELLGRKVGDAFNAEEAVAARNLLVQSANNLRDLAQKAAGGDEAAHMAFLEAETRHVAVQEQVAGMTAEAGRALASFNIKAGLEGDRAAAIAKIIQDNGGRDGIDARARMIAELDTPQQVSKFLNDAKKSSLMDKVVEVFRNALLTGPQTHATYLVSNMVHGVLGVADTAVASGMGLFRSGERVMPGEIGAHMLGLAQGGLDGVKAGAKQLITGVSADRAFSDNAGGAIPGKLGEVIRTPSKVVSAIGQIYQGMGYRAELNRRAYRQASREGLDGAAFDNRVAQLIQSPTKAMLDAAHEAGLDQAFLTPPGAITKAVQAITAKAPVAKFVLPFTTVPGNIMKSAFMERTPLGLFSKEVRDDILGKNGPVAADTARAKMFVGSAIGAGVMGLAAQGLVSGNGPMDPRERNMLMTTGWRPNSVNVGGVWYAYNRFAPIAMVASLSADSVYIAQHAHEHEASWVAANIVASLFKTPLNQSWLSSTAGLIEAVEDPDRYGQKFVQNLVGSMAVPTGLAQYTHSQDPYLRDARTVLDAINARTPWSYDKVPVRRDVWGEPMLRGDTLGPAMLSTIYESRANADPVNRAFMDLNIFPAPLERKIRGVDLTSDQYDRFQQVAGRSAKLMESQIVASPGFANLPDFARRELLVSTLDKARESARSVILMENPQIFQQALATKTGQIDGTLTLGRKPVPKQP